MSKETPFHPRLAALTDEWMDLFGYLAPSVVTSVAQHLPDSIQLLIFG